MQCPNCEGKGYKEYEAGLIQIPCKECNTTGEVPGWKLDQILKHEGKSDDNTSDEGTRSDDQSTRGTNSRKPSKPKKRRVRKKTAKKSRQILQAA